MKSGTRSCPENFLPRTCGSTHWSARGGIATVLRHRRAPDPCGEPVSRLRPRNWNSHIGIGPPRTIFAGCRSNCPIEREGRGGMFDLVQTVDQRGPLGGVLKAQRAHLLQVPATSGADAPGSAPAMAQQELSLPMPGAATVTAIVCTRTCVPAGRTFLTHRLPFVCGPVPQFFLDPQRSLRAANREPVVPL